MPIHPCAWGKNGEHRVIPGEVSYYCELCGLILNLKDGRRLKQAQKPKKPREVKKLPSKTMLRELLAEAHGAICFYCGHQLILNFTINFGQWCATIDHKIPRSCGGTNHFHNLCLSCKACNSAKGDLTTEQWADLGFPRRRQIAEGTFVPVEELRK